MSRMPRPGEPAPAFAGTTGDGHSVSLDDYRGRTLALYFYPMDDTPGCTRQACSLRDHAGELAVAGVAVLGVSTQDAGSHRAFAAKYGLGFPLLADTGGEVGRAYGVLGGGAFGWLRSLLGWNARVTFVIDAQGIVSHVIRRPDVGHHAAEILKLVR